MNPAPISTLGISVSRVVESRTLKQMGWIDAGRIIAVVQHADGRWRAVRHLPRHSVRDGVSEGPVAERVFRSQPQPAGREAIANNRPVLIDPFPEASRAREARQPARARFGGVVHRAQSACAMRLFTASNDTYTRPVKGARHNVETYDNTTSPTLWVERKRNQ